ncbi:pitrilysin family protein [Sulfurovum sp. XTW-4]|uniref:Pitrilysin family protein n=1 Tax=Sulfurovum xiamenensis TaxID=3019066 RepID=A0ABT7QT96_9BACT|nr:pitrilysin family protein [Sulfurovum xiamenensis]MDM5264251.1 pitrilysin family protein [Sulfurovum xiamenensis]
MANSLPEHFTKTLDNGMQIVVIPMDNDSGVITTDIYYKVGSRNEVMGKSGMAHMLEHLSFKSTDKLKEGEFDTIVKSRGGVNNAATGFDKTHYYIKTASKNLALSLDLFSELMHNLKLTDEEFQKERDVVAEERRLRTDNNPMGYLYFRVFNTHFTYHPYHWLPIGFMEDILSWKIEDIRDFYQRYYQPSNAILVVAGDITPEEVFKESEKYFGHIQNKHEIPKVTAVEPKIDGAKRAVLHKESNQVDTLAITYSIPNYEDDDQVVLSAISHILSAGKSSRFEKTLVNEKQLANQVYGYNMELADPGVFLIMAMCSPQASLDTLEKEILVELEKIKNGDVTQAELDKVKINTKAEFIYSLESSSSVAGLYGDYYVKGNIQPLLEYEEKLDKITLKDISDAAKKYFDHNFSTTVILKKN